MVKGLHKPPHSRSASGHPLGYGAFLAGAVIVQKAGSLCFCTAYPFREQLGREHLDQKRHFLRSWNRSTQMPLVRYYSALFQDQLQAPYIGDVLQRIGGDHNQVGELARLHRA